MNMFIIPGASPTREVSQNDGALILSQPWASDTELMQI
jgi:hypothetical protein